MSENGNANDQPVKIVLWALVDLYDVAWTRSDDHTYYCRCCGHEAGTGHAHHCGVGKLEEALPAHVVHAKE